jgi:signal transduction histidine kinase
VSRAIDAVWPAGAGRATGHVLAGLGLVLGMWAVTLTLVGLWFAAAYSLVTGPTGAPALTVLYAAVTAVGLVPLRWWLPLSSTAQRARFRGPLEVDIPPPPQTWGAVGTWRQFGYHLLALPIVLAGGAAVAGCWLALPVVIAVAPGVLIVPAVALLAVAPRAATALARVDRAAAEVLLGPGGRAELVRRVAVLTRSRADVVAASDTERRRIERDLHDGAQQRLVVLAMNLGLARTTLTDLPEPARAVIAAAHDEAVAALAELRDLVRGLHPAVLDDRGLNAALSGIAARMTIPVHLRVDIAKRCSPSIEAIAYFTVSEALTNITKHAGATHASVTVTRTGTRLHITITDDGHGGATLGPGGSGLRGLAQRAAAVDGTLHLTSPPGGPTTLSVELPCES